MSCRTSPRILKVTSYSRGFVEKCTFHPPNNDGFFVTVPHRQTFVVSVESCYGLSHIIWPEFLKKLYNYENYCLIGCDAVLSSRNLFVIQGYIVLFCPGNRGSTLLRNVDNFLPAHMALHPRIYHFSQ